MRRRTKKWLAVLDVATAVAARRAVKLWGVTVRTLASLMGLNENTLAHAVFGRTWAQADQYERSVVK